MTTPGSIGELLRQSPSLTVQNRPVRAYDWTTRAYTNDIRESVARDFNGDTISTLSREEAENRIQSMLSMKHIEDAKKALFEYHTGPGKQVYTSTLSTTKHVQVKVKTVKKDGLIYVVISLVLSNGQTISMHRGVIDPKQFKKHDE